MKKILLTTLLVFSFVFLTSTIVTAGSKAKKDNQNVTDATQEVKGVEVPPNVKSENPVKQLSHSGEIKGAVMCGEDSIEGALVYIPGRSFMAKTGDDGKFVLSFVPSGIYALIIEVPEQEPFEIPDVEVGKKEVTDLGEIINCADNDGDGFDVSEDCNDNDPNVNPDAIEICEDGIDNDCDDGIDDQDLEGCCTDGDGDGFFVEVGCGEEADCDDAVPENFPGNEEICDGIDNNCNDLIDEECPSSPPSG